MFPPTTLTRTYKYDYVADESKNERRSSKLSPISSYACSTFPSSNPFITNSCTEAGYSSVVAKLFDAQWLLLASAAGADDLDKDATEEDAVAAVVV